MIWTDIEDGELLSSIRGKLNTFNNDILAVVDDNILDIQTNSAAIVVNNDSIAANISAITTNATAIDTVANRTTVLEDKISYTYIAASINVTDTAYVKVNHLDVQGIEEGKYRIYINIRYRLDNTTGDCYFRYYVDSNDTVGPIYYELKQPAQNNIGYRVLNIPLMYDYPAGDIYIGLEAKVGTSGDTLSIEQSDIIFGGINTYNEHINTLA